ncbi:MAG: UDP-N-acetylmuramoyl-L-alanine--D-glutamate ligase [Chlamydiota bacterium]
MKKNCVILGMGISGIAAAALLLQNGKKPIAIDPKYPSLLKNNSIQELIDKGLVFYPTLPENGLADCEQVILSPGVPFTHPIIQEALEKKIEVIGEMELALQHLSNPMIGITGSNGKTTTALLTTHVLKQNKIKARTLGNIGDSLSAYCLKADPEEILVLEISSFQLKFMKKVSLDAAIILNIIPNHLDWHGSLEDYARSKCSLQKLLKPNAPLFISHDALGEFSAFLQNDSVHIFDMIPQEGKVVELFQNFQGKTLQQNILASFALTSFLKISEESFLSAYKTFRKPPHRIEFVAEIDEVAFYNDSKATNADAVIHAVNALEENNVILIAGGADKGLSYYPWKKAFADKVKHVVLIGACAEKIAQELEGFSMEVCSSLEIAVYAALAKAEKKDAILLSPGCSSFDMFQNYEHRGNEFKRIISQMQKGEKRL